MSAVIAVIIRMPVMAAVPVMSSVIMGLFDGGVWSVRGEEPDSGCPS